MGIFSSPEFSVSIDARSQNPGNHAQGPMAPRLADHPLVYGTL
jgi:hypothetical protein